MGAVLICSTNWNMTNFILPSQKPNPSLGYVLFLVVLLEYNLHISNHLWLFCQLLSDILQFDNHFQQMVPNLLNYNLLFRIHTCTSSILLINSIYSTYSSFANCLYHHDSRFGPWLLSEKVKFCWQTLGPFPLACSFILLQNQFIAAARTVKINLGIVFA